jgi:hypothetical protein
VVVDQVAEMLLCEFYVVMLAALWAFLGAVAAIVERVRLRPVVDALGRFSGIWGAIGGHKCTNRCTRASFGSRNCEIPA